MPMETLNEPYTQKFSYTAAGLLEYQGWAKPGIATSVSHWRIVYYEYDGNGNQTSITWSDGNKEFDNEWDERASLNYS